MARSSLRVSSPSLTLCAMAVTAALSACGGGGGAGSDTPVTAAPPALSLSGKVATGAALAGATLRAVDRNGLTVCDTSVAADGSYRCDLPAAAASPFVVTATRDDTRLVSVWGGDTSTTLNVTPITHLLAARLSSTGDPLQLAGEIRSNPAAASPTRVQAKLQEVLAALAPVRAAAGDQTDPLTGSFQVDGEGHDRVLDSLQVQVRTAGTGTTIDITVKSLPASSGAVTPRISLSATAPALPTLADGLVATQLVPKGTASQVGDLVTRLNACYALPLTERVQSPGSASASVQHPLCKSLFLGDDPGQFLHDGARVGPKAAFASLLSSSGTGTVFDRGTFEHQTATGDLVLSLRWTNARGEQDTVVQVVRQVGYELRFVGNQMPYRAVVHPYAQRSDFLHAPAFNYRSTGYWLVVDNKVDGQGRSIFEKVVVTSPDGRISTLRPSAGLSHLVVEGADGSLGTSPALRLAARYDDAARSDNPAAIDRELPGASQQLDDAALGAIPDQGVWRFEFFRADGNRPNIVQHARTLTRAPTLSELRSQAFVAVTDAARDAVKAAGTPGEGLLKFLVQPMAATPSWLSLQAPQGADFWAVPAGIAAPHLVTAFGYGPSFDDGTRGTFFNDQQVVTPRARTATVECSSQTSVDNHCDSIRRDSFALGGTVQSLELISRTQQQLQVSTLLPLWIPR